MRTSERHQLKQDRFAEITKDTISRAVENRNQLVGIAAAAVVVVAIIVGSLWYRDYRNEQANTALGAAMATYSAPLRPAGAPPSPESASFGSAEERSRAAQSQFQAIARQYGFTKAGRVARYMAALTALDLGDASTAESELKQVASSAGKDLASQAKMVLAQIYHNTNRNQEAIGVYNDLVQHPSELVSKASAQLELGAVYEAMNQPQEAVKLYADIVRADQQSAAAQVAQQRLMAINK